MDGSQRAPRPILALVGRPNTGKSTLFNRLAGRRAAIVEDVPGVTRDRNYADVEWDGRELSVVDTGGFEPDSRDRLVQQVRDQARLAVDEAQAVVLVVDGREGLTEVDRGVAELLRRSGKPLLVAVNKLDSERQEAEAPLAEFHRLGFGEVHAVSAEHGRGVGELLDAVVDALGLPPALPPAGEGEGAAVAPRGDVRLAVVGRPNVGKSTLVNALLGQERFVVSDLPGTTRDALDTLLEWKGRRFVVTDTAGIRRKGSIAQAVERYSVMRAMRAIGGAEVVACLLDAGEAGVEQDARLLALVVEKGRALVVVVNKWDLAEAAGATREWYRRELHRRLPFAAFAPMLFVSARTGQGVERILATATRLSEQSRARFSTHALNQLLAAIQEAHPAPLARGRPVKLYYVAQAGYAPPTFVIQCSRPEAIGDGYRRFVEHRFREAFRLEIPMRLVFRERPRAPARRRRA